MPIATALEPHQRLAYQDNVSMVAQQMNFPIFEAVSTVTGTGEAMTAADLLNAVEYQYQDDRSRRNIENNVTGSRRWLIRPPEIKSGQYIDDEDKWDMIADPTSNLVRAHTAAVQRGRMDRILGVRKIAGSYVVADGGIYGTSIEGKRPTSSTTALPGSQTLALNVGAAGTSLTINKLRLAIQTLNEADFGLDENMDALYCLIDPKGKDDLIAIEAASGVYLNAFNIQQLQTGRPTPLLGINWIVSNRVPKDSAGNRLYAVWSKANIVEGVWLPVEGDVWNDPHADNKPYCRVRFRGDCTRVQDKGVIIMPCA